MNLNIAIFQLESVFVSVEGIYLVSDGVSDTVFLSSSDIVINLSRLDFTLVFIIFNNSDLFAPRSHLAISVSIFVNNFFHKSIFCSTVVVIE